MSTHGGADGARARAHMYVKFSKAEDEACEAGNCAASIGLACESARGDANDS